jgi:hypothetical protein
VFPRDIRFSTPYPYPRKLSSNLRPPFSSSTLTKI